MLSLRTQECLDKYTATETLQAKCPACKAEGVQASKKLTLYRCPPMLMFHLQRSDSHRTVLKVNMRLDQSAMCAVPVHGRNVSAGQAQHLVSLVVSCCLFRCNASSQSKLMHVLLHAKIGVNLHR